MFDLFRRKEQNNENCRQKFESSFILEGPSAVLIHAIRLDVDKKAAIIITDKEGPDTSLVFTYEEREQNNNLLKGDYYTWKDTTYLVYEDCKLVRETAYRKQKSYECNVNFSYDGETYYGYYVSSLAKYIDTTLQGKINITDNEKPILILAQLPWIKVGAKLVITGKPYKIIDFDAITNDGIVYCSLDRDFIDNNEDIKEYIDTNALVAGREIVLNTNYGYFKSSCDVDIISKSYTEVKFVIPYGINNITITTKDANKNNIEKEYRVVI